MNPVLRYLWLAVKLLVFVLVLGFALKNSHSVTFHSYLGYVWQAPLVLMLGVAFVLGSLAGIAALMPALFRARREAARLRKQRRQADAAEAANARQPLPAASADDFANPSGGAATDDSAAARPVA